MYFAAVVWLDVLGLIYNSMYYLMTMWFFYQEQMQPPPAKLIGWLWNPWSLEESGNICEGAISDLTFFLFQICQNVYERIQVYVFGPCLLSFKTGAEITCIYSTLAIPPALSPNIPPTHTILPYSSSPPLLWQPQLQKKKPLKKKNLRQWNIWDVRACCAKRQTNHFTPLSTVSERDTATISCKPSLSDHLSLFLSLSLRWQSSSFGCGVCDRWKWFLSLPHYSLCVRVSSRLF